MADEWQCENGCLWHDNYWKYDEVSKFINLYKVQKAGCDIFKLGRLNWFDWKKLSIVSTVIESRS